MNKIKVGQKVRRIEQYRDGYWREFCNNNNGVAIDTLFEIAEVSTHGEEPKQWVVGLRRASGTICRMYMYKFEVVEEEVPVEPSDLTAEGWQLEWTYERPHHKEDRPVLGRESDVVQTRDALRGMKKFIKEIHPTAKFKAYQRFRDQNDNLILIKSKV